MEVRDGIRSLAHAFDRGAAKLAPVVDAGRPIRMPGDRLIVDKVNWEANAKAPKAPVTLSPAAEALTPGNAAFRKAEIWRRAQNDAVIQQIKGNPDLYSKLQSFTSLDSNTQIDTLRQAFAIQENVLNTVNTGLLAPATYKAPDFNVNSGPGPQPGVMGYFDPQSYTIQVFPQEWAKMDGWAPLVTVTHEGNHSFQAFMEQQLAAGNYAEGSPQATLARAFKADDNVDESGLSYHQYAFLNVENDSFTWGNRIGDVLSGGKADTRYLGEVGQQFNADGTEKPFAYDGKQVTIDELEKVVGASKLDAAESAAEDQFIHDNPPPPQLDNGNGQVPATPGQVVV